MTSTEAPPRWLTVDTGIPCKEGSTVYYNGDSYPVQLNVEGVVSVYADRRELFRIAASTLEVPAAEHLQNIIRAIRRR